MKKIILTLILSLTAVNVYAWTGNDCNEVQIEEGKDVLSGVTFDLEYGEDYMDMNGNFQESYLKIKFPNLPAGYMAIIKVEDGVISLTDSSKVAYIKGGVHKVEMYSTACDTILKSYQFKAPHYNQFCGEDISCKEDIWFDGTFENNPSNQNKKKDNKVSVLLIVVLVVLLIIIGTFVWVMIKRRRDREKGF